MKISWSSQPTIEAFSCLMTTSPPTLRNSLVPWICSHSSSRKVRSLISSKITSGSGPRFSSILSPIGMYLIACCVRYESPSRPLSRNTRTMPSGSGELPSCDFSSLVSRYIRTSCSPYSVGPVAVLDLERDRRRFDRPQPLRPAVGNVSVPSIVKMKYSLRPSLTISFCFAASPAAPAAAHAAARSMKRYVASFFSSSSFSACSLGDFGDGHLRELGDFLDQVDRADDQPHLGVFVFLAAVVVDADEAFQLQRLLGGVGDGDVVGGPGDAAGEIGDLDRRCAVDLALHVPVQHLRLVVREGRVEHVQLVGLRQELQLDAGRVDQRIGPTELQRVDPLLERHLPRLADQRDVLAVVDRELDRVARGDGREVDVLGPEPRRLTKQQNEQVLSQSSKMYISAHSSQLHSPPDGQVTN